MQRAELMVAAAIALVFAPTVLALARVWNSVEYYSHGFLVALAAAMLVYGVARRTRAPIEPDRRGGALLAGALVLLAAGVALDSTAWQGVALVAALAGAVLALRGGAWLRALAFPIGFLLFAVPLPPEWLSPVVVRLLLFVSTGATALLQRIGVPVLREGNVMVLPGGESLFVAEACSGLTSLVTLLPIAALIAYLAPLSLAARLLLVALAVPIAMVTNLMRVVALTLGALRFGAERATGEPAHSLVGLAVYAVASVLLLAVARALSAAAGRAR
jgi:exosortase